jgi:lysophospholipase L1-like esterase
MSRTNLLSRRRLVAAVALLLVGLLALALGEVAVRLYVRSTRGSLALQMDPELGWKTRPGYDFRGTRVKATGQSYPVHLTTTPEGFRQCDPPTPGRPRLFVLGDSFTHAMNASDSKAFFAVLGRALDCDIAAYGCSGYGTLQETMILERYLPRIQPTAVLLQFCSNDFANNHYPTEIRTVSNVFTRPYWEDGAIRYRMPKACRWLREIGNHGSYLVYFLFSRVDLVVARVRGPGSPSDRAIFSEPESPAVRVTAELLGKLKQRCGDIPLFAFCIAGDAETAALIESFLTVQGLTVIPGITGLLAEHDGADRALRVRNDAHLNEDGEAVLGQALAAWLGTHAKPWRTDREARGP